MHKFFAKTRILGKNIIYLPHCHSTNSLLMQYVKDGAVGEGTVIFTDYQTAGRGQRGNSWQSAPGENLLFSFYLTPAFLPAQKQYLINLITARSILDAIGTPRKDNWQLQIKWPNDIYLNDKKLAGILVETLISGRSLEHAVIGMGLNVGQADFGNMTATSLAAEGLFWDRWELLEAFLLKIEHYLTLLVQGEEEELRKSYLRSLRWLGETHDFQQLASGDIFSGTIIGIDEFGRLLVSTGDGEERFDIQQIKFIA